MYLGYIYDGTMCSEMDCLFRVTVFPDVATVCSRVAILRDRVNRIVDRVNPFVRISLDIPKGKTVLHEVSCFSKLFSWILNL